MHNTTKVQIAAALIATFGIAMQSPGKADDNASGMGANEKTPPSAVKTKKNKKDKADKSASKGQEGSCKGNSGSCKGSSGGCGGKDDK